MAAELKKLAREFADRGYSDFATHLLAQVPVAREMGVPERFPVVEANKDEISIFSPEQREALEKEGYVIYTLTGKSMNDLRKAGNHFNICHSYKYDLSELEDLKSMESEVAINPNNLFIRRSRNRTYLEQNTLLVEFSQDISAKIPGVKAIMGEVPDYLELAFLSPEDHRLFGRDYDFCFTRTKKILLTVGATVGAFRPDSGPNISLERSYETDPYLPVVPLVVPKSNR